MGDVRMPEWHEVEQGRGAPKPWPRDLDEKPGVGEGAPLLRPPLLRNFSRRRFGNCHFIASHSLHGDLRVVAGLSTNGPVCTATQSVLQSSLHCKPKSATCKLVCAPKPSPPFPAKSARFALPIQISTIDCQRSLPDAPLW